MTLVLTLLPQTLAVCRLDPDEPIPSWATSGDVCSVTRTPSELSVVCLQASVPSDIHAECEWRCIWVGASSRAR